MVSLTLDPSMGTLVTIRVQPRGVHMSPLWVQLSPLWVHVYPSRGCVCTHTQLGINRPPFSLGSGARWVSSAVWIGQKVSMFIYLVFIFYLSYINRYFPLLYSYPLPLSLPLPQIKMHLTFSWL